MSELWTIKVGRGRREEYFSPKQDIVMGLILLDI
jgi:hypothetical protein